MNNQENYHTLLLRNQTSLCLDDLVALVINSVLAEQLRTFSRELMEMTPGFTFTLKQAKALKSEADKTLKGYSRGEITDDDLMTFLSNGKDILRGETLKNGGNGMGNLFDRLIHGKEIKKKEAQEQLEKKYSDICNQILECQDTMARCVAESCNLDPSSPVRRNNERNYFYAKNRLNLLTKQEVSLRKGLEEIGQRKLIEEFTKAMEESAEQLNTALGNSAEHEKLVAKGEIALDNLTTIVDGCTISSSSLFEDTQADEPIADSEFDALVVARESRDFRTAAANGTVAERKTQMSEFDARVAAASEE